MTRKTSIRGFAVRRTKFVNELIKNQNELIMNQNELIMNQNELMKSCRFAWQRSVKDGKLLPCKQMVFEQLLDAPSVKEICERIAALRKEDPNFEKQKSELKKMLPIITPHAVDFKSGKRKNEDAILGGLVMLDIDHIENPHELFEKQISNKVEELNIYFVAQSPSGHGLRIIAEREMGLSIEQMQAKLSEALDVEYDAVAKDAARASFLVPRSYVYYYAPLGLFSYPSEEARQYWQESVERSPCRSSSPTGVPAAVSASWTWGIMNLTMELTRLPKFSRMPSSQLL